MSWPTQCPECRIISRDVHHMGKSRRISPDPTPWRDVWKCRKCIGRGWDRIREYIREKEAEAEARRTTEEEREEEWNEA